jgi:hypothetical protein
LNSEHSHFSTVKRLKSDKFPPGRTETKIIPTGGRRTETTREGALNKVEGDD